MVMRGHAQKTLGRLDEAVASYRSAYATRADYGDAYWSLANTKSYRFSEDELQALQQLADSEQTEREDRTGRCHRAESTPRAGTVGDHDTPLEDSDKVLIRDAFRPWDGWFHDPL